MSRRLVAITLDNLCELPGRCRDCAFWELDPAASDLPPDAARLEKEAWVSDTLLEWGSCGQLLHVDGEAAGYALFAPPAYVPRSSAFATSPAAADAVLLTSARVLPQHTGAGLGRMLVQGVARDVVRRGIRAVEAFGREDDRDPALGCLLPAGFLRAVGFKTVRAHPYTPRLRLDVRTAVTWKEDVEQALDRLLASMQNPALTGR